MPTKILQSGRFLGEFPGKSEKKLFVIIGHLKMVFAEMDIKALGEPDKLQSQTKSLSHGKKFLARPAGGNYMEGKIEDIGLAPVGDGVSPRSRFLLDQSNGEASLQQSNSSRQAPYARTYDYDLSHFVIFCRKDERPQPVHRAGN
jgi:hypothetical protein